jgi:hypothetical protein
MMKSSGCYGNELSTGVRHLHCRYCKELGYSVFTPLLPVSNMDNMCALLEGRCPLTHDVIESWFEAETPPDEYHKALEDVQRVASLDDSEKRQTDRIVKHLEHLVKSQDQDPNFEGETKISAINYKSIGLETARDVIVKICMKCLYNKENIFQVCRMICQRVPDTPWMLIEWYFDPKLDSVYRSAFVFDLAHKFGLRGPDYASDLFCINAAGLFPLKSTTSS